MRVDTLARSMMSNDMTTFWKKVQKDINFKMSITTKVDRCVGDAQTADMWKCHYKSLLISVKIGNSKTSVMLDVNQQITNSVNTCITPFNILDALKNIKCGKSSGVDGISSEHFVFADSGIHVMLSLGFFLLFITHGVTCQACP